MRDDHRLDLEAVAQLADARGDLVKHDWRAKREGEGEKKMAIDSETKWGRSKAERVESE